VLVGRGAIEHAAIGVDAVGGVDREIEAAGRCRESSVIIDCTVRRVANVRCASPSGADCLVVSLVRSGDVGEPWVWFVRCVTNATSYRRERRMRLNQQAESP
jgi:hypothetical protein